MRAILVASVAFGLACATAPRGGVASAPASTAMCLPCMIPCTPEQSCGTPAVAAAPAPAPKPAPVVAAPPPPEPAPAPAPTLVPAVAAPAPAPEPAPAPRVAVAKERLELKEAVYFDTGKATIKEVSHGLLDEVATVLQSHADVRQVRIEGHTDATGNAAFNKDLSQRRAQAVRAYLVEKGVEAGRLQAEGYGQERPVASNDTAEGRDANRRVEFRISY